MNKGSRLAIILSVSGLFALSMVSFVGAQTAALTVSCSGTVSSTSVTWAAAPAGGISPYTYLWSGTGVAGATSSSMTANYPSGGTITASVSVSDSATSTATATTSCSAVVPTPTATTTPPVLHFRQPELVINPGGRFLARGMIIQSVASGSFVGKVWGTTWTVNVSPSTNLLLRNGNGVTTDIGQLQVGDEVGVSGRVDADHPGIVNANVVRNYSIINLRKALKQELKELRNGEDNDESENSGRGNSGNSQGIKNQIQNILEQIKKLQEQIKNSR